MSGHIVEVKQGRVEGKQLVTREGKKYFSFSGIPYAKPPQGHLRFKDPVPIGPWEGIRDATEEGGKAAQFEFMKLVAYGSDDCLYLNVFTPDYKAKNLPVIVMIHGGGFIEGSGTVDDFGPDYIVEQDTVLVNINYRLGVMGFLCTDPVNARGDMGLKDQNLALKWVQKNIAVFGGNPDNVTIFGISAGSASVEYHILSPKSAGLFHKAIMGSGSVMNTWAQAKDAVKHAERLAKLMGREDKSGQSVFDFLNSKETLDLVQVSATMTDNEDLKEGVLFGFGPVVNTFEDYDGFLNEKPEKLLKSGRFNKVPVITGFVEYEGMMMRFFYRHDEPKKDLELGNYFKYVPSKLNKSLKNCDQRLRELYKPQPSDKNKDDHVMHFLSDLSFTGGIMYSLNYRLAHNPNDEFFYYFNYDGNMNVEKKIDGFTEIGTCHADDNGYLSTSIYVDPDEATPADLLVKSRMVKMWTDFAKTGNPTPKVTSLINEKWSPVKKDDFKYLEIGSEIKMKKSLIPDRIALWKELYSTV